MGRPVSFLAVEISRGMHALRPEVLTTAGWIG
jgi:hypothetical protein